MLSEYFFFFFDNQSNIIDEKRKEKVVIHPAKEDNPTLKISTSHKSYIIS